MTNQPERELMASHFPSSDKRDRIRRHNPPRDPPLSSSDIDVDIHNLVKKKLQMKILKRKKLKREKETEKENINDLPPDGDNHIENAEEKAHGDASPSSSLSTSHTNSSSLVDDINKLYILRNQLRDLEDLVKRQRSRFLEGRGHLTPSPYSPSTTSSSTSAPPSPSSSSASASAEQQTHDSISLENSCKWLEEHTQQKRSEYIIQYHSVLERYRNITNTESIPSSIQPDS